MSAPILRTEAIAERYAAAVENLLAHAGVRVQVAPADVAAFCAHGVPYFSDCSTCEPELAHDPGFDENAWQAARDERAAP